MRHRPETIQQSGVSFFRHVKASAGCRKFVAVIYVIIERHGGRIDVSSEVNKVTTFTILLPNVQSVAKPPEPKFVEDTKQGKVIELRRKGNVLIVDDKEFIRDIVRKCLSSTGNNVMTAGRR